MCTITFHKWLASELQIQKWEYCLNLKEILFLIRCVELLLLLLLTFILFCLKKRSTFLRPIIWRSCSKRPRWHVIFGWTETKRIRKQQTVSLLYLRCLLNIFYPHLMPRCDKVGMKRKLKILICITFIKQLLSSVL